MEKIHLISNAHIDPVWQWQWEEGCAEGISTFRTAADLLEEYDGFVFNHNEALLYQWIEEYEPTLFERIKKLIAKKKWHIIGGWYLQPDCNLPSGESFVRQVLVGNLYFYEKFGVKPRTGVNFDVFGHSRGLVQILKKSGYDSYVFCRPGDDVMELPGENFRWVGFDGSTIYAYRARDFYNTEVDRAKEKIEFILGRGSKLRMIHWGVGNHGGGASRKDLNDIMEIAEKYRPQGIEIVHSTFEAYFDERMAEMDALPAHDKSLWYCSVGCYTTQMRVKQKHRKLESELFMAEKMSSHAAIQGLIKYPKTELNEMTHDLLLSEFHDALPGTSIQAVEEDLCRLLDHGLEIASRVKLKALFALSLGQRPSEPGDITVMAYNPHPFPVKGIWHCEVHPFRPHWGEGFQSAAVYMDGRKLASQVERPDTNLPYDWRKRIAFDAEFPPSSVSRLVCKFEILSERPVVCFEQEEGMYRFKTDELEVTVNASNGLVDKYAVHGDDYLREGAFCPLVIHDTCDSWGMTVDRFREVVGCFALMEAGESAAFSYGGEGETLPAVRVVEDGSVRTVIEAVFKYRDSSLCQRYILPKRGTEMRVETRVYFNEKQKMLKLSLPLIYSADTYDGQTAYGVNEWLADGRENVSQKWHAAYDSGKTHALTVINDGIAGSDMSNGELRLSILRSPAYAAMLDCDPSLPGDLGVPSIWIDRFTPHADQGERIFRFRVNAGAYGERIANITREAQISHEDIHMVPFTPSGAGNVPKPLALLSNPNVEMTAFKRAERSDEYIIRLFEPFGSVQETTITIPHMKITQTEAFSPYEIVTLMTDSIKHKLVHTNLLEGVVG